ncbi:membrane protein insertion efficiency factor YidD [Deinococcus oregonensis]|uniref:membrane protein insertion efficiency factor YidD n=1 Tax=Deinococcus oregonensis TaxID=1805970 RepID=UPI00406BCCF9
MKQAPTTSPLPPAPTPSPGLVARGMVRVVRGYQRQLSPLKPVPTCRFVPTCSQYALEAIERFGAVRGGWLAAWRVMRCNPFVPGGFDPVPDSFPAHLGPAARPTPDGMAHPTAGKPKT